MVIWRQNINSLLNDYFNKLDIKEVHILEAGGGSATNVSLDKNSVYTTIDISPEQIERNTYATTKICGDIQTVDLTHRNDDLAIAWDLLEHVPDPIKAAGNLLTGLKPKTGIILLKGPIPTSFKGMVATYTPHIVHVWFYRYILGKKTAGLPGYAPFETELNFGARPEELKKLLINAGCDILAYEECEIEHIEVLRNKSRLGFYLYQTLAFLMRVVTFGKFGGIDTEFYIIAKAP